MQVDLSKRYGCLAGGVNDIKTHPWFRPLDFAALKQRTLQPPIRWVGWQPWASWARRGEEPTAAGRAAKQMNA